MWLCQAQKGYAGIVKASGGGRQAIFLFMALGTWVWGCWWMAAVHSVWNKSAAKTVTNSHIWKCKWLKSMPHLAEVRDGHHNLTLLVQASSRIPFPASPGCCWPRNVDSLSRLAQAKSECLWDRYKVDKWLFITFDIQSISASFL